MPDYYRTTHATRPSGRAALEAMQEAGQLVHLDDAQSVGWCFTHGRPLRTPEGCGSYRPDVACDPAIGVVVRKYRHDDA